MKQSEITYLVNILRKVTVFAKILPFVYALLLLASMLIYLTGSESLATICDVFFYSSPMAIITLLVFSSLLKMCKWHKIECCLPLIPSLMFIVDTYIYELSPIGAVLNIVIMIAIFVLSLINGYFVFRK
jgi:hypothetical protein